MDTVTAPSETRPAHGSVDYYAAEIRRRAQRWRDVDMVGMVMIDGILRSAVPTDTRRVELIRSVIVAGDLVRAEFQAAGQ